MITKGIIQIDRKFLKKYDQAKGDSLFKIANTTQVHA
jgi:LysM repeat protein